MIQVDALWPFGDGAMAARIRDHDWAATSLGPIATWSERLKLMVEQVLASPLVSSLVCGPEYVLIYNDPAAMLYGDRHPAALGRPLSQTFPEGWNTVAPFYERAFAGETVQVLGQPLDTRGEGTATDVFDALLMPVLEMDGRVAYVHMTGSEIGKHLLSEATLSESEARHRLLIESWAQAVWETDPYGVVVADSPSWRAYTGQTLEEWLGYGWLDAIHPDDRAHAERQWRDAVAARGLVNAEFRLRTPDGGWRWTNVRAVPVRNSGGTIEKWVGVNIDIDDRRRAEEALRESEGRLQLALEATDLAIYEWDLGSDRVTTTERFRKLVGIGADEAIVGARVLEHCVHPDDRARVDPDLARATDSASDGKFVFEHRLSRLGTLGHPWVLSHGQVYFAGPDDARRPVRVYGTLQDITSRKLAEIAMRESEERQAFVLTFSDTLRAEACADAVAERAIRMLAEQLQLDRCYLASYRLQDDRADITHQTASDRQAPMPQMIRLSDFPEAFRVVFHGTLVIDDALADPRLSGADAENMLSLGMRAILAPTLRKGVHRPLWVIVAATAASRHWTLAEIALVEEVAERTWAAMERARADAALRASEERLRRVIETDAVGVLFFDADGYVIDSNPAFLQMTGYTKEQVDRQELHWRAMTPPEWLGVAEEQMKIFGRTGRIGPYEKQYFMADGSRCWMLFAGRDVGDGTIVEYFIDITDRKQAEQALHESEERFSQFAASSSDALWIRDAATLAMEYTSPAIQLIYGIAPDAILGDMQRWIDLIVPEDRETAIAHIELAQAGASVTHEFRIRRQSDGETRWIRNTDFPLRDDRDRVQRIGGIAEDVTEARELRDRQAVLIAELQHRTRNLMGVVRATADKTMRGSVDLADFRVRYSDRLNALARVQGLLSRLDEGQRITFDELISSEMAALDGEASRVILEGPKGIALRSSTVQTFALALHELATNAVKYGAFAQPQSRLEVCWRFEHAEKDGRPWLHVDWRERGVVMPGPGTAPQGGGSGRELIERALPYQLGAKTTYVMEKDGVHCTIALPVSERQAARVLVDD